MVSSPSQADYDFSMKLAPIALSLALAATTHAAANYTEWMAESFLSYPVSFSRNYANGVLYAGLELAYNKTGNPALLSFIQSHIDAVVDDNGTLLNYPGDKLSLDDIRIGINLLNLWTRTGEEKYKIAADTLRAQIDITPRNAEGGFWHRKPTYPNQMWLDGIYMASNFYARYTKWFQPENRTAWDDIMLQYDLIEKHCRDNSSGLLVHGYDGSGVAVWAGAFFPYPSIHIYIFVFGGVLSGKRILTAAKQTPSPAQHRTSGTAPSAGTSCRSSTSSTTSRGRTRAGSGV